MNSDVRIRDCAQTAGPGTDHGFRVGAAELLPLEKIIRKKEWLCQATDCQFTTAESY